MAIVKRKSLPQSGSTWGTWFNNLGCSIVSGSGNTVNIDNKFTLIKEDYLITCKQGSSTLFTMNCNNPVVVTVACSDTLFYLQQYDPQNRRSFLVYEKLDGMNIMGSYSSGNTTGIAFQPITSLTFYDMATGIEYTHGARLNYTAQLGEICFTGDAIFQAGVRDATDPNFISCTQVTSNQVYAFSLSNFYSVGPNTLVRMDLN